VIPFPLQLLILFLILFIYLKFIYYLLFLLFFLFFIPGAARVGQEARTAAAIVNLPVYARTGLPLTSVQFLRVTE